MTPRGQRLYGPDRLPLEENAAATAARWGYRPFHGVVSLGLRAHPACTPERWRAAAPLLDRPGKADGALGEAARACGVLSFDESFAAAAHAAHEYAGGAPLTELWSIKEGHTASVWCATYERRGERRRIALNVGRDAAASRELEQATAAFRRLTEGEPEVAAARVLAVWKLARVHGGGHVTAVAQTWINDAYEINAVPVGADGRKALCALERFITDPAEPARIRYVRARRLTVEEHARVGWDMALLLRQGARFNPDLDAWSLMRFSVQHGDWVWRRDRAYAVACGAAPVVVHAELPEAVNVALGEACPELDAGLVRAVADGAARAV